MVELITVRLADLVSARLIDGHGVRVALKPQTAKPSGLGRADGFAVLRKRSQDKISKIKFAISMIWLRCSD